MLTKLAVYFTSTALFALMGLGLGLLIHGEGIRAVITAASGAAGGFLLAAAAFDVLRRYRASGRV